MDSTDNERLELAKTLVELLNLGPMEMDQSSNPLLREHFKKVQETYRELFIELTAKHYSIEQMKSEIERLTSPAGQKIKKVQAIVTSEFAQELPSRIEALTIESAQSSSGTLQFKRHITPSRKKDEDDESDA